jgi:translation initiation factor 3 subunit F
MRVAESERAGIDLLTSNLTHLTHLSTTATTAALALPSTTQIESPLATLYGLLTKVNIMLEQVLDYVKAVNKGERVGDERVGRALLETVGVVPVVASSSSSSSPSSASGDTTKGDVKSFEEDFNAHLADVLMVSYLANVLKTQTEISSRLNLLA